MDVTLHLGAHKTASTYLQRRLEGSANALRHHGVVAYGPRLLREMVQHRIGNSLPRHRSAFRQGRAQVVHELICKEERAGVQRLVLSEEQLLGSVRELVLGEEFYENALTNLRAVSVALNGRPVTAVMAVRSYDRFLVSAYGQTLRGGHYLRFDSALRERMLNLRRGWPDLVGDIASALPRGSEILLWRYETFGQSEADVMRLLVGNVASRALVKVRGQLLPGPSAAAIRMLDHKAAHGWQRLTIERIRAILRDHAKADGHAAFDPWTPQERHHLEQRYLEHLAEIRDMLPGCFIDESLRHAAA